jgi:hypothetical protein
MSFLYASTTGSDEGSARAAATFPILASRLRPTGRQADIGPRRPSAQRHARPVLSDRLGPPRLEGCRLDAADCGERHRERRAVSRDVEDFERDRQIRLKPDATHLLSFSLQTGEAIRIAWAKAAGRTSIATSRFNFVSRAR